MAIDNKQDLNRLRNAIHNEADVTKAEIREMVEQAVTHIVEKKVKQMIPDKAAFDRLVDEAVRERSLYYWGTESKLGESVQNKVATKLAAKFDVDVSITRKKK